MTTRNAADGASLYAAVKASAPGDAVSLTCASYGSVALNELTVAPPGVTIRPAAGVSPTFNNIEHTNSAGLHYAGGIAVFIADPTQHNANYGVYACGCRDISLEGLTIHGAVAAKQGPAQGVGVFFRNCAGGMRVSDCEIYDLGVGVSNMDCAGVTITGCDFHDLTTDGIDNAGATRAAIEANSFHDFYPAPGAHPDAIQFWGTPANPQGKDAVVRNNRIWRGAGHAVNADGSASPALLPMQGIFAEDQANMTIAGNAMVGTMFNGISVSSTAGALIEGNFVQGAADMGSRIIARGGSSDVTVRGNTLSDPVVNLRQAGEAANLRFTLGDNASVAAATIGPDGVPDRAPLDAWTAARDGQATPAPTDPKDLQIAALTLRATQAEAALAAEQAKAAEMLTKLSDASRALAADEARITAAQTALGG